MKEIQQQVMALLQEEKPTVQFARDAFKMLFDFVQNTIEANHEDPAEDAISTAEAIASAANTLKTRLKGRAVRTD